MALSEQEAAARYEEATAAYGAALERLARAYEPDADLRRDLLQDVHIALWRSLASFDGRCSLRTWVYRVAHNTATSQVFRRRPRTPAFVSLDELAAMPASDWLLVTAACLTLFVRRRSVLQTIAPALTPAEGVTFYRRLLEHERDFRRACSRWFTIGPALNILVLGLVYAASPLFRGTTPEIAFMVSIFATHVVILTLIGRRLRGDAHRYQMELNALTAATA